MNKNFSSVDFSEISGTSFHDGYVKGSANEISKILGNYVGGDEDKVYRNWKLKVNNTIFAVYDWKEGITSEDDVLEYHIGTFTSEDTERVVEILKEAGLDAYINKFYF